MKTTTFTLILAVCTLSEDCKRHRFAIGLTRKTGRQIKSDPYEMKRRLFHSSRYL